MRSVSLCAVLTAFLAGTIAAGSSAQTGWVDPVTGLPIPLLSHEIVVRFKNGCSAIVPNDQSAPYYSTTYWYGGCRSGLADGPGYTYYEGEYSTKTFTPVTYRWGHALPAPTMSAAAWGASILLPRGAGRDVQETIWLWDPNSREPYSGMAELTVRNGDFAVPVVAQRILAGDNQQDTFNLRIMKNPCPDNLYSTSIAERLAEPTVGVTLSNAQQKTLVPICKAAIARLKSEGVVRGNDTTEWPSDPFDRVDYGYYFVVYEEHGIGLRQGNSYGAYTKETVSNVTLCPTPTSLNGCEPVWQRMLAPYVARRDEIVSGWAATMAADAADLERRFAPLDAAFRRMIAARAARGSVGGGQ
jgi:hypothetical protein